MALCWFSRVVKTLAEGQQSAVKVATMNHLPATLRVQMPELGTTDGTAMLLGRLSEATALSC